MLEPPDSKQDARPCRTEPETAAEAVPDENMEERHRPVRGVEEARSSHAPKRIRLMVRDEDECGKEENPVGGSRRRRRELWAGFGDTCSSWAAWMRTESM